MTNILKHLGILVSISFAGSVSEILIIPNLFKNFHRAWRDGSRVKCLLLKHENLSQAPEPVLLEARGSSMPL